MNALTLEARVHPDLLGAARGDARACGEVVRTCRDTVTCIALARVHDGVAGAS